MKRAGIYIHFPFCKRCCYYCHFTRYPYDRRSFPAYLKSLKQELALKATTLPLIDSIYFGGGSPSLLTARQLEEILSKLKRLFRISPNAEISLEANPEDVRPAVFSQFRKLGVNRLSLGCQSFQDADLKFLKRNHDARTALRSVETALECGFVNINVDFIISLPTQNKKNLAGNFDTLKKLPVPHVSAYILEGVLAGERQDKRDEDMYHFTRDYLRDELGYRHYEVSNFSQGKQWQCRHNLKYWKNQDYIGLGPSASGYESRRDYKNISDLKTYGRSLAEGHLPVAEINTIQPRFRRIMVGLRLLDGIRQEYFAAYSGELEFLLDQKMILRRGKRIAVNPKKILVLHDILSYFF